MKARLPSPDVIERYARMAHMDWFQICFLEPDPPYLCMTYSGYLSLYSGKPRWVWHAEKRGD